MNKLQRYVVDGVSRPRGWLRRSGKAVLVMYLCEMAGFQRKGRAPDSPRGRLTVGRCVVSWKSTDVVLDANYSVGDYDKAGQVHSSGTCTMNLPMNAC